MSSEHQGKAPRRDLQGPRPAPLKICRGSHNIRKPQFPVPVPPMQYRKPVIIYTRSPKVIHTEAREFMALVQRLTGRVNGDGDSRRDSCMPPSSSSLIQSQTCHAFLHSHTSVPVNPNRSREDASPSPDAGLDFLIKEEKSIDSGSNPSEFSGNIRSQHSTVQSLLSPTIQSSPMSLLSPNFFLSSSGLLSPSIFQDFPIYTPQPDYFYSPRHMLCMQTEPHSTPPDRPAMTAVSSLPSPSPTGCDLFNNHWND